MNLKFNKEQLLEALEARRPWAVNLDKTQAAKHKADEKAALKLFRDRCRAALKLSYKEAQACRFDAGLDYREKPNDCPSSAVEALDKAVLRVSLCAPKTRFTIKPERSRHGADDTSKVYWLLTHDENAKKDVCEV